MTAECGPGVKGKMHCQDHRVARCLAEFWLGRKLVHVDRQQDLSSTSR